MITEIEKNLGLSENDFNALLMQMKNGNELLFEKMFKQFFKHNHELLKRKYQAEHEVAYDCVMWAILRMRQMLIENKITYGNLRNYFTRIVVTRYIKSQSRKREFAAGTLLEVGIGEEHFINNEMIEVLEKAWSQLDESNQNLLKGFYYEKVTLKDLTRILGDSSPSNTRKRKERALKKLRKLFFNSYS